MNLHTPRLCAITVHFCQKNNQIETRSVGNTVLLNRFPQTPRITMANIIFVLENPIQSNVMKGTSITQFCIENILRSREELEATYRRQKKTFLKGLKEEDKLPRSYTAIIAQAILSSKEKKLPLGCIYDYIIEKFPQFLKKGQGWKNCVRHNLSLSECFVKVGRARNVRGNYWGIHPRYLKNFSRGDYRKRRANHRPKSREFFTINDASSNSHAVKFTMPYLPEKLLYRGKNQIKTEMEISSCSCGY